MASWLNEREVHGHCDCARRIMTIGASCDATPAIEMFSVQQTTQSEQNDASKGRHRSVTAAGTSTGNNPASRMSWSSRCSRFADRDSTGPAELPLLDIAYAATFCRPPPSGSRHRPLYGCLLSSLDASFGCGHSQCSSARQCLSLQLCCSAGLGLLGFACNFSQSGGEVLGRRKCGQREHKVRNQRDERVACATWTRTEHCSRCKRILQSDVDRWHCCAPPCSHTLSLFVPRCVT